MSFNPSVEMKIVSVVVWCARASRLAPHGSLCQCLTPGGLYPAPPCDRLLNELRTTMYSDPGRCLRTLRKSGNSYYRDLNIPVGYYAQPPPVDGLEAVCVVLESVELGLGVDHFHLFAGLQFPHSRTEGLTAHISSVLRRAHRCACISRTRPCISEACVWGTSSCSYR